MRRELNIVDLIFEFVCLDEIILTYEEKEIIDLIQRIAYTTVEMLKLKLYNDTVHTSNKKMFIAEIQL